MGGGGAVESVVVGEAAEGPVEPAAKSLVWALRVLRLATTLLSLAAAPLLLLGPCVCFTYYPKPHWRCYQEWQYHKLGPHPGNHYLVNGCEEEDRDYHEVDGAHWRVRATGDAVGGFQGYAHRSPVMEDWEPVEECCGGSWPFTTLDAILELTSDGSELYVPGNAGAPFLGLYSALALIVLGLGGQVWSAVLGPVHKARRCLISAAVSKASVGALAFLFAALCNTGDLHRPRFKSTDRAVSQVDVHLVVGWAVAAALLALAAVAAALETLLLCRAPGHSCSTCCSGQRPQGQGEGPADQSSAKLLADGTTGTKSAAKTDRAQPLLPGPTKAATPVPSPAASPATEEGPEAKPAAQPSDPSPDQPRSKAPSKAPASQPSKDTSKREAEDAATLASAAPSQPSQHTASSNSTSAPTPASSLH